MIELFLLGCLVALLLFAGILVRELTKLPEPKILYKYKRKQFFLSRAEHEFYKILLVAVGDEYCLFAQVHLPTILEHKIPGQNWRGAFRHIDEKSVDFVLCDKNYLSPILAIELDDRTHERSDRQERDREVERIFADSGLPLLRIRNHGDFNPDDLRLKIKEAIDGKGARR